MKKVIIEMTETQARLVLEAVEEWFRLRMGQSADLANSLALLGFDYKDHTKESFNERMQRRDALDAVINAMLKIAFPWRGYMNGHEIQPEVHIASDIWSQLRYDLTHVKTEWTSTPFQMGSEPMVKVTVEDVTYTKKDCDNCANKRTHPNSNVSDTCSLCVQARYPDGTESDPSHWRAKDDN
jgi:hypothetical protein